jgi:hypothetical protein
MEEVDGLEGGSPLWALIQLVSLPNDCLSIKVDS